MSAKLVLGLLLSSVASHSMAQVMEASVCRAVVDKTNQQAKKGEIRQGQDKFPIEHGNYRQLAPRCITKDDGNVYLVMEYQIKKDFIPPNDINGMRRLYGNWVDVVSIGVCKDKAMIGNLKYIGLVISMSHESNGEKPLETVFNKGYCEKN